MVIGESGRYLDTDGKIINNRTGNQYFGGYTDKKMKATRRTYLQK